MLHILEKYLVSRLEFIRQISEFLPGQFSEEEEEIVNLLKQIADYKCSNSKENKKKIQQKLVLNSCLLLFTFDQL